MHNPRKALWWIFIPLVTVLSMVTTVFAIDTSSALYTSNILFLNLGLTRANFAMGQPISGAALIDDGFMDGDTLNAVIHEGPNQIPGMPPNNRIVVEGAVIDDGGSFSEFTAEAQDATELDTALLPASPSIGDAAYFGCDNPCRIITVDIGQEGIGDWDLIWEYYDGTAFVTASNVNDLSNAFKRAGQRTISFDMPSDFATTTVTGSAVDAYWVRAVVTDVGSSSQQAIANQEWYENGQWWAWGRSLSINQETLYSLSLGGPDLVENHQIFPGTAGLITPDDPTIEFGDRYRVHWEGAVSFVTASNTVCILCKGLGGGAPFRLYVSDVDTNEVTVEVTGAGTTSLSISGIPNAEDLGPTLTPHVIDIVSDGTDLVFTIDGVGTVSGSAQDVTDTADNYVWMNNGAATYANKMYFFPDEIGFEATVFDTETEWDTGVVSDVVSTGGAPGFIIQHLSEASADDGFWTEGTSAFTSVGNATIFGYSGSGAATSQNAFYRFDTIRIDQGATILAADLVFSPQAANSNATVTVDIVGVDEDDASAPSSFAEAEALTRTTATVAWTPVPSWTSVPITLRTSPDIVSVIQEIVDRPGWVSGNAIVILVEDNGTTAALNTNRSSCTFEAQCEAVRLEISVDTGQTFTDDFIEMEEVSTVANDSFIENWSNSCSGIGCVSRVRAFNASSASKARFGTTSMEIRAGTSNGGVASVFQDIPASAGQIWSFGVNYARTADDDDVGTFEVTFRNSIGSVLQTNTVNLPDSPINYQTATIDNITAPANTVIIRVRPVVTCTGSCTSASGIWLDGLMAAQAAVAPNFPDASNELGNPSFEQVFQTDSTWISPTIALTQTDVVSSLVVWDSFSPFDADLLVETSIDSQVSWQPVANGGSISGINVGDDVSGDSLNLRVTMNPSTPQEQVFSPWMSFLAVVVSDGVNPDDTVLFYELRTTPGVTIEDISPGVNDAIMSYPVQVSGIFSDMTPLVTTRTPLSQQAAIGAGDFAAPVTGSAANLNLFGQDDGSFLPGGGLLSTAAADSGFPIGALWAGVVMIIGVTMGAVTYRITAPNSLPASIILAGTSVVAAAVGDGIIPGWVPIVTIMMLVAWNLLRSRLPI